MIVALAVLALSYGTLADDIGLSQRFALLGIGVLSLFIGVAMLSSRLVVPLAKVVGIPARRIGGAAGQLAEGNAQRNPGRTASTAAALMIGIALVTFVAVLANGLRISNSDAIERQIQADLIVTSEDGYSEFSGRSRRRSRGCARGGNRQQRSSGHRQDRRQRRQLDGDRRQDRRRLRLRWVEGSDEPLTSLGDDGAVLPDNVAEDNNLAVGDRLTVLSTDNERKDVVVRGIYDGSPVLSSARQREHLASGLRRPLRPAAQPLHAHERPGRPGSG